MYQYIYDDMDKIIRGERTASPPMSSFNLDQFAAAGAATVPAASAR
jgi:hypothetical protein